METKVKDYTYLWILRQTQNCGYDTYDSILVGADSKEDAVYICPLNGSFNSRRWAYSVDGVTATKIGIAKPEHRGKVLLESFNAG